MRAVAVEDKNSAVETLSREKATADPGSVGAPMGGVVVEVRVKESQEIMKGDPLCGMFCPTRWVWALSHISGLFPTVLSAMKVTEAFGGKDGSRITDPNFRWNLP